MCINIDQDHVWSRPMAAVAGMTKREKNECI